MLLQRKPSLGWPSSQPTKRPQRSRQIKLYGYAPPSVAEKLSRIGRHCYAAGTICSPCCCEALRELGSRRPNPFSLHPSPNRRSAQNGIVDLFAKNIHATNMTADHGYFPTHSASSHNLRRDCCDRRAVRRHVCITQDQFMAVFGANAHLQNGSSRRRPGDWWKRSAGEPARANR
jgi:hypothetical protein